MSPSLVFGFFCFAWLFFGVCFWVEVWFFFPPLDQFQAISKYIVENILEGTLQNKDIANTKKKS